MARGAVGPLRRLPWRQPPCRSPTILPGPAGPDAASGTPDVTAPVPPRGSSAAVVVEAPTGLAAQVAGGHHAAQLGHRGVVRVPELLVEGVDDGQRRVQPDQVEQLERAHWE